MFGSFTNKLAILGVCAIVYWIICWLVLLSKNDKVPRWLSDFAAILSGLLAFGTAIPSALLSLPIWLNFSKTIDQIRHEEHDKAKNLYEKLHEKDYHKGYDKGWSVSRSFLSECRARTSR